MEKAITYLFLAQIQKMGLVHLYVRIYPISMSNVSISLYGYAIPYTMLVNNASGTSVFCQDLQQTISSNSVKCFAQIDLG